MKKKKIIAVDTVSGEVVYRANSILDMSRMTGVYRWNIQKHLKGDKRYKTIRNLKFILLREGK